MKFQKQTALFILFFVGIFIIIMAITFSGIIGIIYMNQKLTSEIIVIDSLEFDIFVIYDLNERPLHGILSYNYYDGNFTINFGIRTGEDFTLYYILCYDANCKVDTNDYYRFISEDSSYSDKILVKKEDSTFWFFYILNIKLSFDFPTEAKLSDSFQISYYFDD